MNYVQKGFVSCYTIRFGDGVLKRVTEPTKILIMRDIYREFLFNQWLKIISWNLSDKEEYNGTIDYLLERNGKK